MKKSRLSCSLGIGIIDKEEKQSNNAWNVITDTDLTSTLEGKIKKRNRNRNTTEQKHGILDFMFCAIPFEGGRCSGNKTMGKESWPMKSPDAWDRRVKISYSKIPNWVFWYKNIRGGRLRDWCSKEKEHRSVNWNSKSWLDYEYVSSSKQHSIIFRFRYRDWKGRRTSILSTYEIYLCTIKWRNSVQDSGRTPFKRKSETITVENSESMNSEAWTSSKIKKPESN